MGTILLHALELQNALKHAASISSIINNNKIKCKSFEPYFKSIKKFSILFGYANVPPSPPPFFFFFKVRKRRSETSCCTAWKFSQGNALFLSPTFSLSEGFPCYIIFSPLPSYAWAVIPIENNWASILAIQISQDRFCEWGKAVAHSIIPCKQHWVLSGRCPSEMYWAYVQQQGSPNAYSIERCHNGRQIKEVRIAKWERTTSALSDA